LEKKIKDGTFREDLYYRLNVIAITMPSLRERRDDIPLLVAHFLKNKINPRSGQPVQITRQTMEVLSAHDWPGNVRELENAIERAATLCEDNVIQVTDLPPSLVQNLAQPSGAGDIAQLPTPMASPTHLYPLNPANQAATPLPTPSAPQSDASLKDFLREQELAYLNRTLAQTGGDKERAALSLGISLATLYRKLSEDERNA
jgi:DNA-binding NtrC family response regulator